MTPEDFELKIKELAAERDAAQALAMSRSDLIAHVSHEMRAPLNGILGMAQLLLEGQLDQEQREFTELIHGSGDALLTLINDLLDHSKIEAGKLPIDNVPFDLMHTVRDTVRTLQLAAKDKGLALAFDAASGVPNYVVGDPGRLRQILFNLIGNAIKFTHEGSVTVTVDTPEDSSGVLRFAVADSGIGMTAEQAEAIFRPFEQADQEVFRQYGGTGLGLAISRLLTEMMGGTMWVDSAPGSGSTFWFIVQLEEAGARATTESGLPAARDELEVVLVSDSGRTTIASGLAGTQLRKVQVASSDQATTALEEKLAERPAHIVVIDFREEGLAAPSAALASVGDARVIVVTPAGQRGDAASCRELGISAYLTGRVTSREVTAAIDAIVDGVPALITRHWLREQAHR